MTKTRSLFSSAALATLCFLAVAKAGTSPKKGIGCWYFDGIDKALADVNVTWYYTWRTDNQWEPAPSGVQFVPMIWDETHVTKSELDAAQKTGSGILLGFNEPDHGDQADMSVTQALDLWPQLEATGLRLGSPAMATNPSNSGSWLEKFMDGADSRGYRVDFICVHWYGRGSDADGEVSSLKSFLTNAYNKYKLPIWLTEYGLVKWGGSPLFPTYGQQAAFAAKSIEMLESLSFVERYAWFALPPWSYSGQEGTTNLYDDGPLITPTGVAYRDNPPGGTTPNPPSSPTLSLPGDGATGLPVPITLTWSGSEGATEYRVQVSESSSFTAVDYDKTTTSTTVEVPGLADSTHYYWRVNASNSEGDGPWSATRSFTTEWVAPNEAPKVSISAPDTIRTDDTLTLTGTATDDGLPGTDLTALWSVAEKPRKAEVEITSSTTLATTVRFSHSGTYVLDLTVSDGDKATSARVTVVVEERPAVIVPPAMRLLDRNASNGTPLYDIRGRVLTIMAGPRSASAKQVLVSTRPAGSAAVSVLPPGQ